MKFKLYIWLTYLHTNKDFKLEEGSDDVPGNV
jgi:hypothetical protein